MNRDEAFEAVQKIVRLEVVLYLSIETKNSWILVITSPDGQPLIGASPFVVKKSSREVSVSRNAALEFLDELTPRQKFIRWMCRKFVY